MTIRSTVFSAIALALGGVLLTGCGVGEASVPETAALAAATAVPVETTTPLRLDIYASYAVSGTISSDSDAPVVARVAGEVVDLIVEEGDRVEAGQLLARLDGERLRLEMLSAKASMVRAEKAVERNNDLYARGLVSAAMFDELQFELQGLEASYALKQLNYDYSNIRATISGIVSVRQIKTGQHLASGDVAFRITETSELLAYLQIPQAQLPKFKAGHAATVTVASMPGAEFAAHIERISPTIDARTGTFRATAVIDNAKGDLAPGMFGRFEIAYEKHTDALLIPSAAILDEDAETTVYVVNNGEVVRRIVEVGIVDQGRSEILRGLNEEDEIVVIGHSGLRDGSKVLARAANQNRFTG